MASLSNEHERGERTYLTTTVTDNARAILEDVAYHTHHHYVNQEPMPLIEASSEQQQGFIAFIMRAAARFRLQAPDVAVPSNLDGVSQWVRGVYDATMSATSIWDVEALLPMSSTDSSSDDSDSSTRAQASLRRLVQHDVHAGPRNHSDIDNVHILPDVQERDRVEDELPRIRALKNRRSSELIFKLPWFGRWPVQWLDRFERFLIPRFEVAMLVNVIFGMVLVISNLFSGYPAQRKETIVWTIIVVISFVLLINRRRVRQLNLWYESLFEIETPRISIVGR